MTQPGNHIGTLLKPNGYKGELLLRGNPQIIEKLTIGIPLFIELSEQGIPFFIEKISFNAAGDTCIVKLEFINSDREASPFVGCEVYMESKFTDSVEKTLKLADYIGYIVKDSKSGDEFEVLDYYENQENPLLILGRKGKEILLPKNADYILYVDQKNRIIEAEFPEGLGGD